MASFKTDESFLEKISIGAIGTQQVFSALKALGHQPIELERGSMNYKIWKKIKIKRIRVPDILCVDNGIRIESRAKTNLEISMSHSTSDPERGWDFGMKDNDYVALVVCKKTGINPIDWKAGHLVQFISIKELREAEKQGQAVLIQAKGSQEGFEARIIWPAGLASAEGIVSEVGNTIKYKTVEGRTNFVRLTKGGKTLLPLVNVGDSVFPYQIIASVVKVEKTLPVSKVNTDYFLSNLSSITLSDRYAAAKALGYFNEERVIKALQSKLSEDEEHIYVKLEAAASLSRLGVEGGFDFISHCLHDNYLQNVLESVIVLAEIKSDKACRMLCEILLDEKYNSEIRAGAAWGLGEQQNKEALIALVNSFSFIETNIRIEAARALAKLTTSFSNEIVEKFKDSSSEEKHGIAWALAKSPSIDFDKLMTSWTYELKEY